MPVESFALIEGLGNLVCKLSWEVEGLDFRCPVFDSRPEEITSVINGRRTFSGCRNSRRNVGYQQNSKPVDHLQPNGQ